MNESYVSGRNPVRELLKNKSKIDKIYVQADDRQGSIKQIIAMARNQGIVVTTTDKKKLDSMAKGASHQGVVAMVTDFEYSTIEEILSLAQDRGQDPFVVILDQVEDTQNLGAIVRTCEAAGVHGVIIPERRSAQVNETVHRTSSGAIAYMKVARVTNIAMTLDRLKEEGLWIYGAHMEGEDLYKGVKMTGPIGLVIGGENKGLTKHIQKHCDVLVKIPMFGQISSLNASASAAVMIYEIVRQRTQEAK